MLEEPTPSLRSKQAKYASALQNARNLAADIDVSNATLKLADRHLRDASIRAPFDGYVQKRLVSLGELVKGQMPVMAIVRVDPLKVTAEIPERMAPWIQSRPAGRRCRWTRFPDRHSRAGVAHQPGGQPSDARVSLRGAGAQPEGKLKPGTFAAGQAHDESSSSRC